MSPIAERAIQIVLAVSFLGAWGYYTWVMKPEREQQRRDERKAQFAQRFKEWAYVVREKEIAPGETVKLVVIPDSMGIVSTKCFIYANRDFKTSSMICPDAKQDDID